MPKHHLIISGTGRAGTTFLVQLFTELGLDTGFSHADSQVDPACNAGMEWDLTHPSAPYVVKKPALGQDLDELLETGNIVIDCAIIPIRELYASAESRRTVQRNSKSHDVPGGLILTPNPGDQEAALAMQLHHLVHTLAKHDVPMVWLHFPRLVQDADYLYKKLTPVLTDHDRETFSAAFEAVSRPELVHHFKSRPVAPTPAAKGRNGWFGR